MAYSFAPVRPPRVRAITFTSYICCIYITGFGQYWTLPSGAGSSVLIMPYMQFLFVRPRFCPIEQLSTPQSSFLQIPPHDGHPCLRLTVPTAKSVVDFHHQVIAHAGRTPLTPPYKPFGIRRFNSLSTASCIV